MKNRVKEAVLASFVGDSLALGVHWIYNTRVIERKYGRVEELLEPELASFHKGKSKGAFTHYGDQMFLLLAALKADGETNLRFMQTWLTLMESGACYLDGASKETMAGLVAGGSDEAIGSSSTDLAGASRIAPLLLQAYESTDDLIDAARVHTGLTHSTESVREASAFFACTAKHVLDGCAPVAAMDLAVGDVGGSQELREALSEGIESRDAETGKVVETFGQQCDIMAGLPSTIHLIAKYEENLKEALIENVMAGGDSAARGMLVGLTLGAAEGIGGIPETWVTEMVKYQEIKGLLDRF